MRDSTYKKLVWHNTIPSIIDLKSPPPFRYASIEIAMIKQLVFKLSLVALILSAQACYSNRQLARMAFSAQDYCTFCDISAKTTAEIPESNYGLGQCYENGWCGYTKDKKKAIEYYTYGARWGLGDPIDSLNRLKQPIPSADYAEMEIRQIENQKKNMAILGAVVLAGAAVYAASRNGGGGGGGYACPQRAGGYSFQGCCSWHDGIEHDYSGCPMCFAGAIKCQDGWTDSSCRCS